MSVTAADRVPGAPAPAPAGPARWRWTASLAAAGAGALHVAAATGHADAGDLVVGFFLLTALAQLGLGLWLARSRWTGAPLGARSLAAALAGTVLLVGVYLLAHTSDVLAGFSAHGTDHPHAHAGHHAGASMVTEGPVALGEQPSAGAEAPDLLGTATVALELLTIVALTALLPRGWRGPAVNGLFALGALAWGLWLTGVLA